MIQVILDPAGRREARRMAKGTATVEGTADEWSGRVHTGDGARLLNDRLPIVAHYEPRIEAARAAHLRRLAEQIRKQEPNLGNARPFGDHVRPGFESCPSLVLEDHSWIELFETLGDVSYSYRACILAGRDDLVAVGIGRCPAFEDYCRTTLGLGDFEVLAPCRTDPKESLSLRCARDPEFVGRAAAKARQFGGLNVLPYMGTGGVWHLAGRIAAVSGVPVSVAAPPPNLTRRVNNKLWFARRMKQALGRAALPDAFAAYGLAALIQKASILARRNATVAVKLPASASSAGNIVLDDRDLIGTPAKELREQIDGRLRASGWRGEFPLMVTAWEAPVLSSPSVQLWIPLPQEGEVAVEGIFDQALRGTSAEFVGATRSTLGEALCQRLADEAAALGYLFQELGYFGRCSLDSIIVGESEEAAHLHWIECNGRWGGTSIPMTLANRLIGDWTRAHLVIAERDDFPGPSWTFQEFCDATESLLLRKGGPPRGIAVLSPSRVEAGTGYELLVLAPDFTAAEAEIDEVDRAFKAHAPA
jgi:hypothetical protein